MVWTFKIGGAMKTSQPTNQYITSPDEKGNQVQKQVYHAYGLHKVVSGLHRPWAESWQQNVVVTPSGR